MEVNASRDKLISLRRSGPIGREDLSEIAPYGVVSKQSLQDLLASDEVLLLVFPDIDDNSSARGVLYSHSSISMDLCFSNLTSAWSSFSNYSSIQNARSGMRKGQYASKSIKESDESSDFWDVQSELLQSVFWSVLGPNLQGKTRLIVVAHGILSQIPFSPGKPKAITLTQFSDLLTFAAARGLFGGRKEPDQPTAPHISIVRGDHADLQYSPLEEEASVALWRSAGADVSHPDYPSKGPITLLHVTSHGDLLEGGSPVILLGRDASGETQTLSERDILRGPLIEAAFLNVCLGGRLSEGPLDGSPSGLVSALMRRGAKVVVAALPPVDDLWACVLGLMVTEAMATEGLLLDRALTVAKRRLGEGVPERVVAELRGWYTAKLEHVVRDHAGSNRRKPEACARAALKAAMGNADDRALLTQLTAALADVPKEDRAETATRLLVEPAWTAFEARLAQGPGPAEYGALVHGMITFGESAPAS